MRGVAISRHVATVSWRLLSRDRELLAVPVIATAAFTAVAVPGVLLLGRSGAARTNEVGFWLVLVAAGVLAAGVVARSPSSAARGASTRRLLGWAALAGVLSFAGSRAEERLGIGGRVLARAARTTVGVVSVVVQPSIMRTTRVRPVPSVALLLVPAAAVVIAGVVAMGAIPVEVVVVVLAGSWTAVVLAVTSVLAGGPRRAGQPRERTRRVASAIVSLACSRNSTTTRRSPASSESRYRLMARASGS